jgi:RNA polymerase sigma factor (sigma-70 family)
LLKKFSDLCELRVSAVNMTEKEKALIAGCLRSEKAAWGSFVLQYSNLVYHTIKKTLNLHHVESCADLVEDLYQELFLSLLRNDYKKLRQFRGAHGCSLASWLRILAARLTIDFLRKQSSTSAQVTSGMSRHGPDPAELFIDEEQEQLLNQAIQTLSPRDRILLDLCYRQALDSEKVAALLKTSVNAIYAKEPPIRKGS